MKLLLFYSFIFSSVWIFSQDQVKPYQLHPENLGFTKQIRLDGIDPTYFDLYRSKEVDNTVIVRIDGEEARIILLSASKLKSMGQAYNEALVEKGAMMSGAAANNPRTFIWSLVEGSKIEDLTTY